MSKRYVIRSALLFVLALSVLFDPGSQAMAQTRCADELSNANQAYNFGRFDEAITLLKECLKKRGVVRIEQQRSHRLLALSYIGKDEPSRARDSVRDLVVSQPPVYHPDPEQDPPPFVQMVEEVQQEVEQAALSSHEEASQQGEEKAEDTALDALVGQAEALYRAENYREALPLFQKAAQDGSMEAQAYLGVMYEKGQAGLIREKEAANWYRKAAEQGHPAAQFGLGLMYREGRGVGRDDEEAMAWFRKAAEQGHADAQFYVGWLYWKGQGAAQNDEEAMKWYRKAAAQGHERAQRVLDRMTGG